MEGPRGGQEEEAQAGTPGSAATSSGSGEDSSSYDPLSEYFIRHKLTKLDTLAGLAVRYNVTVSDIKRANGMLADNDMFCRETLLIPTRPLPVGPEYSMWVGMIVTHYGRLGPSDDSATPSETSFTHFSQTRAMQQLRGYSSSSPSRSASPRHPGGDDSHHLFARGAGGGDWGTAAGQPQQVELMERNSRGALAAAATYIEDRLRRRGRTDSQAEEAGGAASSSGGGDGGGGGAGFALFHRPPLFSAGAAANAQQQATALASAGGRQIRQWKESLLHKLKKVASQPALAVPPGQGAGMGQLGAAAVASVAPQAGADGRASVRQRASASGPKAD